MKSGPAPDVLIHSCYTVARIRRPHPLLEISHGLFECC